jgi:acyl-CoA dehydrogenase
MNAIPAPDAYQELREAVRALCKGFDSAYWQQIDGERGYPEAFVDELTRAGWLAAMIPAEYGGSELGLAEASVIMEEVNQRRAAAAVDGGDRADHGNRYDKAQDHRDAQR